MVRLAGSKGSLGEKKKLEDGTEDECVGEIDQRSRKSDDGIKE